MFYFIYKPIYTGSGHTGLPTITGITGGQGIYKNWELGTADDYNKLWLVREFNPRLVTESVWNGLPLIGLTQVVDSQTSELRDLTVDETTAQTDAYNWELKENLRFLLEMSVGDGLDQLANTDRQLHLITGMIIRMYRSLRLLSEKLVTAGVATEEEIDAIIPLDIKAGYSDYADNYSAMVDAGIYKDRTDIEDPAIMIPKLMECSMIIQNLVKTEYLDKLR